MSERPLVAVYEPDDDGVEQLVQREMNDDEFAVWQDDVARAAAEPEPEHPLLEQAKTMNEEERAELRALLAEEPA